MYLFLQTTPGTPTTPQPQPNPQMGPMGQPQGQLQPGVPPGGQPGGPQQQWRTVVSGGKMFYLSKGDFCITIWKF